MNSRIITAYVNGGSLQQPRRMIRHHPTDPNVFTPSSILVGCYMSNIIVSRHRSLGVELNQAVGYAPR